MSDSQKEKILQAIYNRLESIKAGAKPYPTSTYTFENSVSYIDRQFVNITPDEVIQKPKPWIVINNEGEQFDALPSRRFDNTILLQIVGFVEASNENQNLDSLMNSLQKDILVAMLSDVILGGLATSLYPKEIITVPEMYFPFGGFVLFLEVNYTFTGLNL